MGMQRIDLADQVKSLVTIQEVAEHYGFHPNRAGYICCPFHNEKTASLKLYDGQRGFHCFGCGAGGTVIDFVMKLFDIPFRKAILRINADFALGLTWEKPDPVVRSAILETRRREDQRKAKLEQLKGKHRELATEHRYWWNILKYFAPTRENLEAGYIHPLYTEAVKKQPYLEYLLDELEEEIAEVKADRGRKCTTAGKHRPGGPGQTA